MGGVFQLRFLLPRQVKLTTKISNHKVLGPFGFTFNGNRKLDIDS